MKNNKGFTLVELLAVIVILMALAALITPKIFSQLKTAGDVTEKEQINSLINISKIYMNQHPNLIPDENEVSSITIEDLKQAELIKSKEIINPNTGEELTGCIVVTNKNNKIEYEYRSNCTITVTFDANGGSVSQSSKEVTYGKKYNDLPTPTKEGYTFLGWNGRNYYNYQDTTYIVTTGITTDDKGWITINTANNSEYYNYWTKNLDINKGTQYNLFLEIMENKNVTGRIYLSSIYNEQGQFSEKFSNPGGTNQKIFKHQITARTGDGNFNNVGLRTFYHNNNRNTDEILTFRISVLDVDNSITESNFEYEPYYITSSTPVVQQKNHTLKAIWQANS